LNSKYQLLGLIMTRDFYCLFLKFVIQFNKMEVVCPEIANDLRR
jgi:hypothetical protein